MHAINHAHREFSSLNNESWTHTYSRMKFGDDMAAKEFGVALAESFYRKHTYFFDQPTVIIAAPSSATVPFASPMIAHHMMQRLNLLMMQHSKPLVDWTTIHRTATYYNNYAALPAAERQRLLAQDSLFMNKDFIVGKRLIFVDDCVITGTHEKKIEQFLTELNINNERAYACYAMYKGDDPSIEHRLNHCDVPDADALVHLMNVCFDFNTPYMLTTRAIRMLLEHPSDDFARILDKMSSVMREELLYSSIAKLYHEHKDYQTNFEILYKYFCN